MHINQINIISHNQTYLLYRYRFQTWVNNVDRTIRQGMMTESLLWMSLICNKNTPRPTNSKTTQGRKVTRSWLPYRRAMRNSNHIWDCELASEYLNVKFGVHLSKWHELIHLMINHIDIFLHTLSDFDDTLSIFKYKISYSGRLAPVAIEISKFEIFQEASCETWPFMSILKAPVWKK